MAHEPTGEVREVPAADLFFSTTDRRGVIEGANSVFCSYAAYELDDLLGKPHNVIRHPDMPGGLFHVMWDLIESGRPMAAYVKNLAADGVAYWVFATITPLDDGYLSVRQTPSRADLWDAIRGVYDGARDVERTERAGGASRAVAAERGAAAMVDQLAAADVAGYEDFMRIALPAEVAARREHVRWAEPLPDDPQRGLVRRVLAAAIGVDQALDGLDGLDGLSQDLAEGSEAAGTALFRLRDAVASALSGTELVGDQEPVLARVLQPLSDISTTLYAEMTALRAELDQAHRQIGDLRIRLSLARLHAETVAQFAREMGARRVPPSEKAYVRQLCEALEATGAAAAEQATATTEVLTSLATRLVGLETQLRDTRRQLATWRLLVTRYRLTARLAPYTGPIDTQLSNGMDQLGAVRGLASDVLRGRQPYDPAPLVTAVREVRRAGAAFARPRRKPVPVPS